MPANLVLTEVEREVLAGAFRATDLLETGPHDPAQLALDQVATIEPEVFTMREHRAILAAVKTVMGQTGRAAPRLVLIELRKSHETEAIRLLSRVPGYGLAPVAGMGAHIEALHVAAAGRARWRSLQEKQAEFVETTW